MKRNFALKLANYYFIGLPFFVDTFSLQGMADSGRAEGTVKPVRAAEQGCDIHDCYHPTISSSTRKAGQLSHKLLSLN